MKKSLHDIFACYHPLLSKIYDNQEAKAILYEYFSGKWKLEKHDIWVKTDCIFNEEEIQQIEADMERLLTQEPVQYVIENTIFYGLSFKVTQAVLIPRPETEELVQLILRDNKSSKHLRILDIGCGSGVIAITLRKLLPNAEVWALDYSEEALNIAHSNAQFHRITLTLMPADILKIKPTDLPQVDIIVSNPPYIPIKELAEMNKNVIDFEPHKALFVPDEDPLLFYQNIAQKGISVLSEGGSLYFETHHLFHRELINLLQQIGYQHIESLQDLNGRNRFIKAKR